MIEWINDGGVCKAAPALPGSAKKSWNPTINECETSRISYSREIEHLNALDENNVLWKNSLVVPLRVEDEFSMEVVGILRIV